MRISDWSSDVCSSDLVGFGDESSASRQRAGIGLNPSGGYENGDLRPTLGNHARARQAGHSRHLDIGEYRSNVVTAFKNGERSEEHTSELQSLMRISYAVFCLKKIKNTHTTYILKITPSQSHQKTR